MVAMVLLAATCALKPFRFGKIQTMVITGLSGGFGFFMLDRAVAKIGHVRLHNDGGRSLGTNRHSESIGVDGAAASRRWVRDER